MTRIRQRTEVMDRIYRTRLGIQVLINAVTVHVGTGTNLSGLPTNQELASQNILTSLLIQNNFRLACDLSKTDAKSGDHFPQADFSGLHGTEFDGLFHESGWDHLKSKGGISLEVADRTL
jgi:hypothetical protein